MLDRNRVVHSIHVTYNLSPEPQTKDTPEAEEADHAAGLPREIGDMEMPSGATGIQLPSVRNPETNASQPFSPASDTPDIDRRFLS